MSKTLVYIGNVNSRIKGTLMQISKSAIIFVLYKINMLKISQKNSFYFLRYAQVRYVKGFVYKHSETIDYVKNWPTF